MYPALEQVDGQVRLTLFDDADAALIAHRQGVARLIWLGYPDLLKQNERDLRNRLKASLLHYGLLFKSTPGFTSPGESLVRDILNLAALIDLDSQPALPRNPTEFNAAASAVRPRLSQHIGRIVPIAQDCLAAAIKLEQRLSKLPSAWKAAQQDLRGQLADLVFPGFLMRHPMPRLTHLPRYLKAMEMRLDKLANQPARDLGAMNEMSALLTAWRQRRERLIAQGRIHPAGLCSGDADMDDFRWRLEELRVSLFAQELKTPEPVSVKRLEKRWAEIAGR
jgi:ATP-dependent helicase HrpA